MPTTFTGRASIYGIDGTLTYSGVAAAHFNLQGANLTHEFDTVELRDAKNKVIGAAGENERDSMEIEFIPVELADGTAIPDGAVTPPAPFARVVLTDFPGNIDGNYYYPGGARLGQEPGGWTKMTLPVKRYKDVDLSIAPAP